MKCETCKTIIPKYENYGSFYYCKKCDRTYDYDWAQTEFKSSVEKGFQCPKCGYAKESEGRSQKVGD